MKIHELNCALSSYSEKPKKVKNVLYWSEDFIDGAQITKHQNTQLNKL